MPQRTKSKNMADSQNDTHTEIEQCKDLSRVKKKLLHWWEIPTIFNDSRYINLLLIYYFTRVQKIFHNSYICQI